MASGDESVLSGNTIVVESGLEMEGESAEKSSKVEDKTLSDESINCEDK